MGFIRFLRLAVEIVCFLTLLVLGGAWAITGNGAYEPWTYIVGLVFVGIEIWRKFSSHREEERRVAEEALTFLHNEGLFYTPYHYEKPLDCYESADKIRDKLVEQSGKVSKRSKVFSFLDQIREHCQVFRRTLQDKELVIHDGTGWKNASFEVTSAQMGDFYKLIKMLRMDCHPHIRSLAKNYGYQLHGELKKEMDSLLKQSDNEGS
jgi:hypothetical protein